MDNTSQAYQINANSGDRLGFGLFVAAAVHACLIFGLAIKEESKQSSVADMEITLVTHYSQETPDDADFWAQQNQEASGTKEDVLMPTSPVTNAMQGSNQAEGLEMREASLAVPRPGEEVVSTTSDTRDSVSIDMDAEKGEFESQPEEMARRQAILARLDALQQDYARRPKIGTLTSVSAKARDDAEYQLHLQDRIVATGNANYPADSLIQGVFGSLRLMLTISQNGTLESIEILESSGSVLLDQAALKIARMSAPFNSFPDGTAQRYDKIVFIRTWQFLPGGRLQTGD